VSGGSDIPSTRCLACNTRVVRVTKPERYDSHETHACVFRPRYTRHRRRGSQERIGRPAVTRLTPGNCASDISLSSVEQTESRRRGERHRCPVTRWRGDDLMGPSCTTLTRQAIGTIPVARAAVRRGQETPVAGSGFDVALPILSSVHCGEESSCRYASTPELLHEGPHCVYSPRRPRDPGVVR
jgi:hypothetical protein